jgi:predicted outer membrane repeat protein
MRTSLTAGLVLLIASVGTADVRHVNADGSGEYATIRDAMYACDNGDTVELADGVYTGYGNRDLVFAGTALTIRSASGDPLSCIIDCQGSDTHQHRGFKFDPGVGRESVLEGVTIRNGCMIGQPMPPHGDNEGAAIRCKYASPTISDCRFESNTTDSYFAGGTGGAVFCIEESSPLVENCIFIDNTSGLGGGMRCLRSDAVITGCAFVNNHANSEGGGLSCWSCEPVLIDNVFINNTSADGGGLSTWCASVQVEGCLFSGNTASERGGGVYSERSPVVDFTNCLFEGNTSNDGGGAIFGRGYGEGLFMSLTDVEIVGNSTGESGGAMKLRESVVNITGALIAGNTAAAGGVIAAYYDSELTLASSTVADNEITGGAADAGALRMSESSSVTATRTIIAGNDSCAAVSCGVDGSAALVCCDAFGNTGGDWVGCIADQYGADGNFRANPLFCLGDNPEEPYALHNGSPCLPENSHCGELVGAFGEGCSAITSVRDATWGAIKARFR